MSTKYNNKNVKRNVVSRYGKIVIYNVPKSIIRTLLSKSQESEDAGITGSISKEGRKAIYNYLECVKKVNVKEIIKSGL